MKSLLVIVLSLGLGRCSPQSQKNPVNTSGQCIAPEGMGSPQTIQATVELLNTLPGPVTVACFVQALDRPLVVSATTGVVSAQPAGGPNNPRFFIDTGGLLLSVVPDGRGRDLLEIGEEYGAGQTLKGEFLMPLDLPVLADSPYDHLRHNDHLTVCGLCHRDERLAPEIGHPNAYVSVKFRPLLGEVLPLERVRLMHESCDAEDEPERCAIFSALFDHGEVVPHTFSESLSTIFDR